MTFSSLLMQVTVTLSPILPVGGSSAWLTQLSACRSLSSLSPTSARSSPSPSSTSSDGSRGRNAARPGQTDGKERESRIHGSPKKKGRQPRGREDLGQHTALAVRTHLYREKGGREQFITDLPNLFALSVVVRQWIYVSLNLTGK